LTRQKLKIKKHKCLTKNISDCTLLANSIDSVGIDVINTDGIGESGGVTKH